MRILKLFFIAIILVLIGGFIYLNTAFKGIAEDYASQMTGTKVAITAVTINPFGNSVSLRGLDIGNPKGFEGKNAIEFGSIYSNINLASLLTDKILINEVKLDSANIYYELGAGGDNIRKILANIKSYSANSNANSKTSRENSEKPDNNKISKSLLIKDLHVTNSKVVLTANLFDFKEDKEIAIDDIHLTDINSTNGKAVAKQVGNKLLNEIAQALIKERARGFIDKLGGAGSSDKVMEGLKNLF